eukprot:6187805-Pleurochrysis_carterae.AAC.1
MCHPIAFCVRRAPLMRRERRGVKRYLRQQGRATKVVERRSPGERSEGECNPARGANCSKGRVTHGENELERPAK